MQQPSQPGTAVLRITQAAGVRAAGLALAGVLLLAGCGPTEPSAQSPATSSASAQQWDPQAWEPAVTITPPTFTEEERWAAREQWLSYLVPDGVSVPDTELIRWTQGQADHAEALAQCLTAAGFPGEASADGGVFHPDGIPEEQDAAYALANYVCNAQYSLDVRYLGDWSAEQIGVVYDYLVEYYIPCMKAHGQRVNEQGRPTREVFIATFFDDSQRWWPYPDVTPEEVQRACPQLPPEKTLYGG